MPIALLFPGQNSRYPGMVEKLLAACPANREWIDRASDVLSRDLLKQYSCSNDAMFTHNRDVQVGVFLANHLHLQSLERGGVRAAFSAGLSLGEYNHLVHIGALTFEDALRILDVRGSAYQCGPRGKMTAVLPVDPVEVADRIRELHVEDRVGIGMINSPRQSVLSGECAAVDSVAELLEDELFAQCIVVDERLPMHSPLYETVGEQLRDVLNQVTFRKPSLPYLPNVMGEFLADPSAANIADGLRHHTCRPVQWQKSMELLAAIPGMRFVEVGPRSVLTNLFGRKWLDPKRYFLDSETNYAAWIETLLKELTGGAAISAAVG